MKSLADRLKELHGDHLGLAPEYNPKQGVARNRGSCSCAWKGPWRLTVEQAQEDLDYHIRPFGPRFRREA
jgi:hypothetical protein